VADVVPPPVDDAAGPGRLLEIACQEFVELVTDHLEGVLPPEVERAVREHLALCEPCVEYLEQIRRTTAALADLPTPTLATEVEEQLLAVFTQVHRARSEAPAPGPVAPRPRDPAEGPG
jgi:anti-sigma factor RsiW